MVGHKARRRIWIALVLLGTVTVVALGTVIAVRAWLTEEPHDVGVQETVDHFRTAANEKTEVDGVYVYDTAGTESIDALGGDSHTYPVVSALTVMTEGCGVSMTWKPLDGRSESWMVCPSDGGLRTPRTNSEHTFFRQTYDTGFICEGSWWVPPTGITEWTSSCENADRTASRDGRVVGTEPYEVGGEQRQAIHVQWVDHLSRGSDGTVTTDVWIDRKTGLMLREHTVTDSRNDSPVGKVTFREGLDLKVRTLEPLR